MKNFSFAEFRPTVFFLLRFVGLYMLTNMLYGIYITAYHPKPDPITHIVTVQTAATLRATGWAVITEDHYSRPVTNLVFEDQEILAVYEGCNGVNTMLMFLAFIVAFGPWRKPMLWFIPMGIVVVHLINLLRISLLFFVSRTMPDAMYFVHKYLFTASLYAVIFVLWIIWIRKFTRKPAHA
ncbi:exosortase family protein XrtF [Parachryseolinea silvisoli]|uniref:exosortase family protein XrtF n=1 Tax=Parachryseolinea silvisoli TaxID=2873601 RepID=UPI002265E738|nr:exosortase family protein XrtF [Parachryseolinea silvisoli]MCD9019766.1 exosortase family protein XrtF [Parachryseolinea silvisoli]